MKTLAGLDSMSLQSMGLKFSESALLILDQTLLPNREVWLQCQSPHEMIQFIKELKIRGAPLIGVGAALAPADSARQGANHDALLGAAVALRRARPTAVNLMFAMDRMMKILENPAHQNITHKGHTETLPKNNGENHGHQDRLPMNELLWAEALEIFHEDVKLCNQMADHGAALIEDGDELLTHCNAGGLATAGIGTSIGVIRRAHEQGKRIHVYIDETRPLLQGARLTAWELGQLGIHHTLICDNMAATLMSQGKIRKVFVGADRIAANGDFANKIGTYSVAIAAHHHGVHFYPVAPYTTVDLSCPSGRDIPIEQRNPREVMGAHGAFGDVQWAPQNTPVYNPSFDVTPVDLITGLVLDSGYLNRNELRDHGLQKKLGNSRKNK